MIRRTQMALTTFIRTIIYNMMKRVHLTSVARIQLFQSEGISKERLQCCMGRLQQMGCAMRKVRTDGSSRHPSRSGHKADNRR